METTNAMISTAVSEMTKPIIKIYNELTPNKKYRVAAATIVTFIVSTVIESKIK